MFRDKGNKGRDDDCLLMKAGEEEILQRKEITTPGRTFLLSSRKETSGHSIQA